MTAVALPTWVVTLDTGRLGDWVVVKAVDETAALKTLTRTQRKKVASIRRSYSTSEYRAAIESGEIRPPRLKRR